MLASGNTKGSLPGELITGFRFDNSSLPKDSMHQSPVDVFQTYLDILQHKHLDGLATHFGQKFETQKHFFEGIDVEAVVKATAFVTKWVSTTNPAKMSIDVTEDVSIILTLAYLDGRDAYLEFFFEPGAAEPVQHNLAIYKDSNPLFSYGGDFTQTLGQFFTHFEPFAGLRP